MSVSDELQEPPVSVSAESTPSGIDLPTDEDPPEAVLEEPVEEIEGVNVFTDGVGEPERDLAYEEEYAAIMLAGQSRPAEEG